MRTIRKVALVGLAALMLCAALATSASAFPQLTDSTTNTALAAGSSYNIKSEAGSHSTLTGSFFGFGNTTITCTSFEAVGTVQHNPGASGSITSAQFTGCKDNSGNHCTSNSPTTQAIAAVGLPWAPTAPGVTPIGGGIVVNGTTDVFIGTGTNGYFTIPGACTPTGSACNVTASGGTVTDGAGDHQITNRATATWVNNGDATIVNQSVVSHSSTFGCITGGTWNTGTSTVRTGSTVGSGNLIKIDH